MKKLFLSFTIGTMSMFAMNAQCVPDFTASTAGLYPAPSTFTCAEQGVALTGAVMTVKNFTTAGPGGAYTIDSISIDSITNVPCGLKYAVKYPNGRILLSGEAACINFAGTTSEAAGQYQVKIYGKVYGTPDIPLGIEGTSQDLSTIGGLNTPPLDFRYWVRVKPAGGTCATLDMTPLSSANKTASCKGVNYTSITDVNNNIESLNVYPNPATSNINLTFTANESTNYTLTISSLIGQELSSKSVSVVAGDNEVSMDISKLAKGNYLATLKNNHTSTVVKFTVQ